MDEVLDEAGDLQAVPAEAEAVAGTSNIVAQIRSEGLREVDRIGAQAVRDAEALHDDVGRQIDQLRAAAARHAELIRSSASCEADQVQAEAAARAEEHLAAAQADAERQRTQADRDAADVVDAAVRVAAELPRRAAEEAGALHRAAAAAAVRIRADAQEEAARLVATAAQDLESAREATSTAEATGPVIRAEADRDARALIGRSEEALAGARATAVQSDLEAAVILGQALREAASALDSARGDLEAAGSLLVAPPGVPSEAPPGADEGVGLAEAPRPTVDEHVAVEVAEGPPEAAAPAGPFLVPVLGLGRELVLRLLVWGGLLAGAFFWVWWLGTGHGSWSPASVLVGLLLAWVFALPMYFLFFACRMTRPNPMVPLPDLRVAMVVTKAPSEPWSVVRRTIEAMLDQDIPLPYDVWLADERPAEETERWCADHGVHLSSRFGVAGYQNQSWPRRKRCKEGNLAFFYDRYGYERYDVVAHLDADHVPAPDYLEEVVRPFADPAVGYVCAPSVCDANADQGWTVRGRLYREATLHGPVQAGSNNGYAPVCIGSHYAVRTTALREVGGIGPELAEDYTTTLWLQSAGWVGVFNIGARAHGDGPESLDEMLLQEVQWARSLGTILVRWAPGRMGRVPLRARVRLAFALAFYLFQGCTMAVATILPLVGVALRTSWGETSIVGFYIHLWPYTLVLFLIVAYLRRRRLLRPMDAKLWSWELVLFQLVRWPWTFGGFLQGMWAGARSEVVDFKVTQKATPGIKALRVRSLVPTLALGVLPAAAFVLVRDPGEALGLQIVAIFQGATYLGCAVVVVALHLAANRRRRQESMTSWHTWTSGGAAVAVTASVVAATGLAVAWRLQAYGLTP